MGNKGLSWKPAAFAGTLLVAAGVGFGLARLTGSAAYTPSAPTAAPQKSNEVALDPMAIASAGIEMEKVARADLAADIDAPATVRSAPNSEAIVTAHAAGTVVRLLTELGDTVHAGATLAFVESKDAAAMAADVKVAQSRASLAHSALVREQELFNQRVTPRQDLERAQAEAAVADAEAQRAQETAAAAHVTADGQIAVTSPIAGKVTAMLSALGTFVQADTELFRVTDPKFVRIEAAVPAADAQRIVAGDSAVITTRAGETIDATVRSVTPTLNQETRSATVVLSVPENHRPVAPGQAVQVTIRPRTSAPPGFVVPEEAVQNVGGGDSVFVRTTTGFRVQPVVLGIRAAGRVSVTSGLQGGETIATTNAFLLKAELQKGAGEDE